MTSVINVESNWLIALLLSVLSDVSAEPEDDLLEDDAFEPSKLSLLSTVLKRLVSFELYWELEIDEIVLIYSPCQSYIVFQIFLGGHVRAKQ